MNDMKSLNQGIYFSVKKDSFQSSHPEYMKYNTKMNRIPTNIIEGFQEGVTGSSEQNLKVFSNQRIYYNRGNNRGTFNDGEVRFMNGSLEEIKNHIKGKGDYLGFEYVKRSRKAYFMKKDNGDLPKNGGKIPTLKHKNGVETWLVVGNGMPEAAEENILGDDEIAKLNAQEKVNFSKQENDFKGALTKYEQHMTDVLDKAVASQSALASDLKNKIVKVQGSNRLFYINGYGVKREFVGSLATNKQSRGSGCGDEPYQEVSAAQLDPLPAGQPMAQGEDCRTGGINVKSKSGQQTYWLDKYGMAHKYQDFATGRHSTCPSHVTTVEDAQLNAYQKSNSPWLKTSACIVSDTSSDGGSGAKAKAQNDIMIDKLGLMKDEVDKMIKGGANEAIIDDLDSKKAEQRKNLITTLNRLKKERAKIQKLRQEVDAADYNVKDKKVRADGIQMRYIAWALAGFTLASMTVKLLNK